MNIKSLVKKAMDAGILLSVKEGQLIFEATGERLSDALRKELRQNKEALIKYLESLDGSEQGQPGSAAAPVIERRLPTSGQPRVSYPQQRLWFIDKLGGGSSQYNMVGAYRLEGELDRNAFTTAFRTVVERHEILRTNFVEVENAVYQRIHESIELPLHEVDLTSLPAADKEKEVRRILNEDATAPYDLEKSALFRIHLLTLAELEHVAIINMHHIVSDAWSLDVLMAEFAELYAAYRDGRKSMLEPLEIQYADYSEWQRRWLEGDDSERQLAFWRQFLADVPSVHNLPLDYNRPPQQTFSGKTYFQEFDSELAAQIKLFCAEHRITVFMFLQTALALLIHRYSNESDVVIGTPIAGRVHGETERLIGFFVNTLVIRTNFEAGISCSELLRRNKKTILDVFSYQHTPFEFLVEEVKPARSLSYNPIFQIMFNFQNVGQAELSLPGLKLSPLFAQVETAKFDLSLDVAEIKAGMLVNWGYNTSLFREGTVARFAESFKTLVQAILRNPREDIGRLPILQRSDMKKLLSQWNRTVCRFPEDKCIHDMFEAQVASTPEAVAVTFAGEGLCYAELDARANQLAHHLTEQEVIVDTLVGLCMERSPEMVIAMLGVLKAGGAYVPLDPDYPDERVRYMAKDAKVQLILTQRHLQARWQGFDVPSLSLDGEAAACLASYPRNSPDVPRDPASLAYVIYTSGSTGKPKGVMMEHGALVNRIDWMQREYQLQADDRVLQKTPYSFDVSVWEFFWPLTMGARIVMAKPGGHRDPHYLREVIEREEITTLHFVPSVLSNLLDTIAWGELTSVRRVFSSGEALSRTLVERYWATRTSAELHNLYGPTEAAIDVSYWDCREIPEEHSVPIGRPISNVQLYVLDEFCQPVPVGCFGELHIGGVGLARGYIGNLEMTREKFIPDPFSGIEGRRLYKTGDLARWLPGGYLEYAGRLDHQVKLHGLRIELGEIEAQLRTQPDVLDGVVTAEEEGDVQRLVGYIVSDQFPENGQQDVWQERKKAAIASLKAGLKLHLPEYMVPSQYVFLGRLPLTANGKVDRNALPKPGKASLMHNEYVAPQLELERQLCSVWQDILRLEQVGIHDNFFEIGGNSLLCVQVQRLVHDELGLEISLTDIFEYPTPFELAQHLSRQTDEADGGPTGAKDDGRTMPESADIAIIGMAGRFPEAEDVDAFWTNLAAGHEALREFTDEELLRAGVGRQMLGDSRFVKAGVILDGIELFDAGFFRFTPREAEVLDPQQRLLFECAVVALEQAGYGDDRQPRHVGVFVGQSESQYFIDHLLNRTDLFDSLGVGVLHANSKEYTSTRLSYKLNLSGPSVSLGSACSTSLVAVHQACASLLHNECRMALAGGASISLLGPQGYVYQEGGIASPDGHCCAFDKSAAGTRAGSGAGMVLLKRLDDALADGDTIYAVIKGSAINNDGAGKVGYTAPSITGQSNVIRQAQNKAGVNPESIQYLETHGTGTKLGDPIEIKALENAFATKSKGYCALGTLKPNIGHLDSAAGVAGLIKAVKVLEQKMLPPCINYSEPNPQIDFENSPFYMNTTLKEWVTNGEPRRAGVSSFGIGGTNAHVVLEEAPHTARSGASRESQLLFLSAKSAAALAAARARLACHLRERTEQSLADVAYTLQVGRAQYAHRCAVLCKSSEEAASRLEGSERSDIVSGVVKQGQRIPVVMMFTGQGSQYKSMSRDLYEQEPVFRDSVDGCAEILMEELGCDIREVLYSSDNAKSRLGQTDLAQPSLFVVEFSLAKLLESWGVEAAAMIGHSLGEYVAACLAGVFDLPSALRLVAARGRLMQKVRPGSMLSVKLSENELLPLLTETGCSLAAVNGPEETVASGTEKAIASLQDRLKKRQIETRMLHTSHAFHSEMMDEVMHDFRAILAEVDLKFPQRPYISNLTGGFINKEEAVSADYWLDHLRGTVRFSDGIRTLLADTRLLGPNKVMVEVGPGFTLSSLVRRHDEAKGQTVVPTLRHAQESGNDGAVLLRALAQMWVAGVEIDSTALYRNERRLRVPLPTYPFERQRYWIDVYDTVGRRSASGKMSRVEDWFYEPAWFLESASLLLSDHASDDDCWLIFADGLGVGNILAERLREAGQAVSLVRAAGQRADKDGDHFVHALDEPEEYRRILDCVRERGIPITRVVHLWSLDAGEESSDSAAFETTQRQGVYSVLALAQALMAEGQGESMAMTVVTRSAWRVNGSEALLPAQATVGGLCKVLPQEYPELRCYQVDIAPAGDLSITKMAEKLAVQLWKEIGLKTRPIEVAYRGSQRWIKHYQAVRRHDVSARSLREQGVYLLTGGLGNIGLALADYLARTVKAKLALVTRNPLPPRDSWPEYLREESGNIELRRRLQALIALEASGADVEIHVADASDPSQMEEVFARTESRFGTVNGVIHCAGKVQGAVVGLQDLEPVEFESQYRAKVHGLFALDQVLADREVDFCLVMSSLSAVLGGLGFGAYAAANAFTDAFVQDRHNKGDERWLSVNWDGWTFGQADAGDSYSMTTSEGYEAFVEALRIAFVPQLVNSTGVLSERLEKWVQSDVQNDKPMAHYARPELETSFIGPRNAIERKLAQSWQELLGIEQVGVHDNFFALGGDSLLATRAFSMIRHEFSVEDGVFSLKDFFSRPEIEAIAVKLAYGKVESKKNQLSEAGIEIEEGVL